MCANVRHVLVYSCSCSWTVVYGGSANVRGHIRGRATLPVQLPLSSLPMCLNTVERPKSEIFTSMRGGRWKGRRVWRNN